MAKRSAKISTKVIQAAGGIIWRKPSRGEKLVALVHRPVYDDWTFPKGKLNNGEAWAEAALREVREETGLAVRILGFAGTVSYLKGRTPKVVLYWHMDESRRRPFKPVDYDEVDDIVWVTVAKALRKLTHPAERRLLREAMARR